MSNESKNTCCPNYEQEYYRQQEQLCKLLQENENLKQALVNIALQLGK